MHMLPKRAKDCPWKIRDCPEKGVEKGEGTGGFCKKEKKKAAKAEKEKKKMVNTESSLQTLEGEVAKLNLLLKRVRQQRRSILMYRVTQEGC